MSDEQFTDVIRKLPLEGLKRLIFSLAMLPFLGWLLAADHLSGAQGANVLIALIAGVFAADVGDKITKRRMISQRRPERLDEPGDEGA